ncbi:histidinol-phosphate aminotransferase [Leptospira ryugenii]|uniref:Histidinol-phosphate aminotransferase n=2 Tax=Leptospira ryugenii TaxID=1917863 RepID=A0A2P2DX76_9LEPT|nr:histidinol-phosphate aminotransferase [Leptospira ryugenii]
MKTSQISPRKEVLGLSPYTPGEQPKVGERVIKLNTNENPYPPSPKIKAEIQEILDKGFLRKYPHYNSEALRNSIAKKYKLHPDQILVTNGSDEALRLLFQAVLGPGDSILAPEPTYSLYPVLVEQLMCGVRFETSPLLSNLHMNLEDLQSRQAKLLAFAHPNAPTGIKEAKSDLISLIKSFPGYVLSDEAYIDFAEDGESLIDEIQHNANLIVTRTFSKSYSLAGLRVGYLVASKELVANIQKLKDSYNVGMLEQKIAQIAFEDETYFSESRKKVIVERQRLKQALEALDFFIPESHTNFLFCKPLGATSPEEIYIRLKDRNIFVRYFSKGISRNYVRISIGTSEESDLLLEALREIL